MENKIVVALKGIVLHEGKALIIKRAPDDVVGADTWEFIGGKLDFGEALEDGLKREIKEEAGLTVTVDRLLYATEFKTDPHRQVVILNYLCRCDSDQVVLSEEHSDYRWAGVQEMKDKLWKPILDDLEKNKIFDCLHEFNR